MANAEVLSPTAISAHPWAAASPSLDGPGAATAKAWKLAVGQASPKLRDELEGLDVTGTDDAEVAVVEGGDVTTSKRSAMVTK
jgi:hypothetical protein